MPTFSTVAPPPKPLRPCGRHAEACCDTLRVFYNILIHTFLHKVLPLRMIGRTLSYCKIITSLQNTQIIRCYGKQGFRKAQSLRSFVPSYCLLYWDSGPNPAATACYQHMPSLTSFASACRRLFPAAQSAGALPR